MRFRRVSAAIAVCATLAVVGAAPASAPASAMGTDDLSVACLLCFEVCTNFNPEGPPQCTSPAEMVSDEVAAVHRIVDPYVALAEQQVAEAQATIDEATHVTSTVGAGSATGAVSFAAPGVPKTGDPCAATSFSLSGSSEAFAINTVITGYAGPVTLTGSGSSTCESTSAASGLLTLTASGTGPTGSTVQCTSLTGGYTRVATDVIAQLGGTCVVNNYPARVTFVFRGQFVPTGVGAGVTTSIRTATFAGGFAVAPA